MAATIVHTRAHLGAKGTDNLSKPQMARELETTEFSEIEVDESKSYKEFVSTTLTPAARLVLCLKSIISAIQENPCLPGQHFIDVAKRYNCPPQIIRELQEIFTSVLPLIGRGCITEDGLEELGLDSEASAYVFKINELKLKQMHQDKVAEGNRLSSTSGLTSSALVITTSYNISKAKPSLNSTTDFSTIRPDC
jgi:hypothetical protein